MKLNLGCGPFVISDFINVDQRIDGPNEKEVLIVDLLRKPWPWPDNSADVVVASHFLQELPWRELVPVLKEIYRVLKPGGIFRLSVPHIDNGKPVDELLGWSNINLFDYHLLYEVLTQLKFGNINKVGFKETYLDNDLAREAFQMDNREGESLFMEAVK